MNKVILLGYLAAEPEVRHFDAKNGSEESILARINIAVNDMRNRNVSYFINCVAWNQTAQYIGEKLHKGDFVAVDGRLVNRNYVNKEGKKVYVTEVSIDAIRNYGSKKQDASTIEDTNNEQEEYVIVDKTSNQNNNDSNDWENDLE